MLLLVKQTINGNPQSENIHYYNDVVSFETIADHERKIAMHLFMNYPDVTKVRVEFLNENGTPSKYQPFTLECLQRDIEI